MVKNSMSVKRDLPHPVKRDLAVSSPPEIRDLAQVLCSRPLVQDQL